MLVVVWFVRLELSLQELGLFIITYVLTLVVWFFEQTNARRFGSANCELQCIAPPS